MKNIKKVAGSVALSFLALALFGANPASAETTGASSLFLNAHASLKADALIRLESATGVVVNGSSDVRVMGAEVTSASDTEVRATAEFGNSTLNFIVKVDEDTKLNGKVDSQNSFDASDLEAGDKVSFAGRITSSTSSSVSVDADHLVSREFVGNASNQTTLRGEIQSINDANNTMTVKVGNRTVTVNTTSSTTFTLDGSASTFAALDEGDEVRISGDFSSSASVVSATSVSATSDDGDEDDDEDNDDEDEEDNNGNNGADKGEKKGWFKRLFNWLR